METNPLPVQLETCVDNFSNLYATFTILDYCEHTEFAWGQTYFIWGSSGSFEFPAARVGSSSTAAFWINRFCRDETTSGEKPDELCFAVKGRLDVFYDDRETSMSGGWGSTIRNVS